MKRLATLLLAAVATVAAVAQTLNVEVGSVTYQILAAEAGEMLYADASSVTILNKVYALSDITRMYIDATEVEANTVSVAYDGTSAKVFVAGNIAQYVTPTISGAHVSIAQSDDLAEEITYSLSGTSTDGEFTLEGSYKATVELRGLTLTNQPQRRRHLNINNGKRIHLSVKNGHREHPDRRHGGSCRRPPSTARDSCSSRATAS